MFVFTRIYGLYPFRPTFSTMPRAYKQQVLELALIIGTGAGNGQDGKKVFRRDAAQIGDHPQPFT